MTAQSIGSVLGWCIAIAFAFAAGLMIGLAGAGAADLLTCLH